MNHVDIDFLPPDWRAHRAQRRTALSRMGVLIAAAGAVALAQALVTHHRFELDRELTAVDAEHSNARGRIAAVEELDQRKQELASRLDLLKDALKRTRGAELVGAVGRSTPAGVTLDFVEFRVSDVSGELAVDLTVKGTSTSHDLATELNRRLGAEPIFNTVRLVSSENTSTPEVKEFVITATAPGLLREPPAALAAARDTPPDGKR